MPESDNQPVPDKTTREEAIEAIRTRMVEEMGACGRPEDCHRAVGGCCALNDAIDEYEGQPHAE